MEICDEDDVVEHEETHKSEGEMTEGGRFDSKIVEESPFEAVKMVDELKIEDAKAFENVIIDDDDEITDEDDGVQRAFEHTEMNIENCVRADDVDEEE